MERVIEIIAKFLKVDEGTITEDTVINRKALQGSILIHRMYAELAALGYKVPNYHTINTYGDLLNRLKTPEEKKTTSQGAKGSENESEGAQKKKWFKPWG